MKHYEGVLKLLGMRVTRHQGLAMEYLERQGQRFCVEFGISNCIENARAHWRSRRKKRITETSARRGNR